MVVDYRQIMGVERLALKSDCGSGVRVAILDSGTPPNFLYGRPVTLPDEEIDHFGHATAVASILFGGFEIRGVCEMAEPAYFKVLDDSGMGSVKSVVDGIYRALEADVDLINLSLGFFRSEKCPKPLEKACLAAFEAGKPIICAAGNDGGLVNWPAALKTTICVGSAGGNGLKTAFSSVGEVDFVAPGLDLAVLDLDGGRKAVSGTSFSTALVTGVAALMMPRLRTQMCDSVDVETVRYALKGLARDVDAPGWDETTGYGLISGEKTDPTVGLQIEAGFFGRILSKIKSLFGIKTKEH